MWRSSTKGTGPTTFREVTSQLDVPTYLTPAPGHLLRCRFVGCAKEVNNLINHPVVSLLCTRVVGTCAEVVPRGGPQEFRSETLDSSLR